jgi:hypothetical protein
MKTAVESAESFMGICLYNKVVLVKIRKTAAVFKLKYPNIIEVKSVILSQSGKREEITNDYGFCHLQLNQIHLNDQYQNRNIEIEYLAGFKDHQIPYPIKQGLIMHVALMYEHSEQNFALSSQIRDLYLPYRIMKI